MYLVNLLTFKLTRNLKEQFLYKLKSALNNPLPGYEAQKRMEPEGRNLKTFEHRYDAAVLIAFYLAENEWRIPLIHRVDDGYAHSGQVSFPGGTIESGESATQAALREAEEEVGLNRSEVEIIGQISDIQIPVSKFLVSPVVGIISGNPHWQLNKEEVQSLFTVSFGELTNPNNIKREEWQLKRGMMEVPFFDLHGFKIWGATAMMLSELLVIMENHNLFGSDRTL